MTIRKIQWQLYFLGCFPSDLEQRKAVDGIWGPLSEEATRNFQRTFGVAENGIFDTAFHSIAGGNINLTAPGIHGEILLIHGQSTGILPHIYHG